MRLASGLVVAGRYELTAPIGEGPMGEVHRARDRASGAEYALKLFRAELSGTSAWNAYLHEAQRAADVPGVLRVWDAGVEASTGAPFVLSALAEGRSLGAELSTTGPLAQDRAVAVLKGAAAVVSGLHGASIVHRGLVPSNVFVSGLTVSVSDVGVAALRAAAPPPSGPIAYGWAPVELAGGAAPAPTMDVWSLGALLFFALTGRSPFVSLATPTFDAARLWTEMNTELPPLSARARELGAQTPPQLDPFFARALAISPGARFSTVAEAVDALAKLTARKGTGTVMLGVVGAAPAAAVPVAAAPVLATPASPAAAAPTGPSYDDDVAPPKKKSALPVVLGLGAVALVGLAVVAALYWRGRGEESSVSATSAAPASAEPAPSAAPPPSTVTPPAASSAPPPAATTSRVTFTCTPECDEVACDGKPVEGGNVELAPGKHRCVGKRAGHLPATDSFVTKAGEDLARALTLTKAAAPTAPPAKKCGGVFIKDCK